jgi:hypothetical protein
MGTVTVLAESQLAVQILAIPTFEREVPVSESRVRNPYLKLTKKNPKYRTPRDVTGSGARRMRQAKLCMRRGHGRA